MWRPFRSAQTNATGKGSRGGSVTKWDKSSRAVNGENNESAIRT